jgi:hypothetical protein
MPPLGGANIDDLLEFHFFIPWGCAGIEDCKLIHNRSRTGCWAKSTFDVGYFDCLATLQLHTQTGVFLL